jgi:aromatic ring-cleaving dioxygenase
MIREFHAHIYFDSSTQTSAAALREKILACQWTGVKTFQLIDRPIGPHPTPSFELEFGLQEIAVVLPWLILNRAGHSILVHPVTGDDPRDHFEHCIWLGEKVALDASKLDPSPDADGNVAIDPSRPRRTDWVKT